MSNREEKTNSVVEEELRDLERFWQARPPKLFRSLYNCQLRPLLAPCAFFPLESIVSGAGREYGMLPCFLPFARASDESGTYGFFVTSSHSMESQPILFWEEDEMFMRPAASNFAAFLRGSLLHARFEQEGWPQGESALSEEEEMLGRIGVTLPDTSLHFPRNQRELSSAHIALDPQDAYSLCNLGCFHRSEGADERALDLFSRAVEATPWFGDPYYLVADVYRERGNLTRAVEEWWAVIQSLLPLCTRTWEWELGEDHPEADIYEVAADGLAQFNKLASPEMRKNPLWRLAVYDDPYNPDAREILAENLLAAYDIEGAEREYLNALSLCCREEGRQPERIYNALIALYEQRDRRRLAELAKFDSNLPRALL